MSGRESSEGASAKKLSKLGMVAALKQTALRAKSRVVTRREAQGKANERVGGTAESEISVAAEGSGSRKSISTSFRNIWRNRSKSISDRQNSGGSPTFTSVVDEPTFTAVPKLNTASLSPGPPTAAASSDVVPPSPTLSPTAAPLSDTVFTSTADTPRPGAVPAASSFVDASEAPAAAAPVVAAKVLSPGTPRPGYTSDANASTAYGVPVPPPGSTASSDATPASPAAAGGSPAGPAQIDDVELEGDFEDEDLPVEVSSEQDVMINESVAKLKFELTTTLGVEAAKWWLSRELLPPDATSLELKNLIGGSLTIKAEEFAAGRPKPPDFGAGTHEAACLACWRQRVGELLTDLRSPEAMAEAEARGEPWSRAVLEAKREVMDPNKERLEKHLETMWSDHMAPAKAELAGSRLRTVMKAKALRVHQTLKGAMDDVERQFREGMTPFVMQKVRGLDEDQVGQLCTAAVRYFREGFDQPWALATLEKELEACMPKEEVVAPTQVTPSQSIGDDPLGWLLGLVLGAAELPLPTAEREWLASATAAYLDPFIDGEVPSAAYHSRSDGFMMARLQKAWEADRKLRGLEACEMPIPPLCALAQYATHSITKMNANLGFGPHMPGIGRQPTPQRDTEAHFKRLGEALVSAIQRDFNKPDQAFGSLPCLTPGQIVHVGTIHLKGVISYQQELGNALAVANRDGEEARREERMRIWGYA